MAAIIALNLQMGKLRLRESVWAKVILIVEDKCSSWLQVYAVHSDVHNIVRVVQKHSPF